jgi:endonuclease/exonuclease/phosphatase family metal-dependent hydrolase
MVKASETASHLPKGRRDVSVLTWNIHSSIGVDGKCDPNRIANVLGEAPFDIICLQEVGWHLRGTHGIDQYAAIRQRVAGHHYVSLTKTQNAHFGNLLISNIPFVECETIPLGRWWGIPRVMQSVKVKQDGASFHILNLHLGLDPLERTVQLNILNRHVASLVEQDPSQTLVMCGDFNAIARGPGVRRLESKFHDARSFRTFPSAHPLLNLDRMLVRNGGPEVHFEIVRDFAFVPLSDHLPVAARFQIGTTI